MKIKLDITRLSHYDIPCRMNSILSSKTDAINSHSYFENQLNTCRREERVNLEKSFLKWQTELKYKVKLERQIRSAINAIAFLN